MSVPVPRSILAPNPSLMTFDGTRSYIVGWAEPVVIDPGPDIPSHMSALLDALAGHRPVAIVLTHSHPDHAAGAVTLARITGAEIWLAPGGLRSAIHPDSVGQWIDGGEVLQTDAGRLDLLRTPGHTPDHVCIRWQESEGSQGAAFVGDLLSGKGDTTFVGSPEGDVADYLRSLDLIESLGCAVCYPAHGPPLDPRTGIERHRAHRLARIEAVRRLLRENPDATDEALVARIYGSALDPRLRPAACVSVAAMRKYLRSD